MAPNTSDPLSPAALAKLDQVEALLRDVESQLARTKQLLELPADGDTEDGNVEAQPTRDH